MDLVVEKLSIDALIPYANNAKDHPPEQVAQIAASIREFGFNDPIAVDAENGIIEGHGRLLAARAIGMAEVPVIRIGHLSGAQKRAYILAHNKLTLNSGFDIGLLRIELDAIRADGLDLALTGFDVSEIAEYVKGLPEDPAVDTDDAPDPPVTPTTHPGDLYEIGPNRLICGDSRRRECVNELLNGATPNLMVTDPPYGVSYDPEWRKNALSHGHLDYALGRVTNDEKADWHEAWALFPGNIASYIWHAGSKASCVQGSLEVAGFSIRAQIIWAKNTFVISRGDYHWQHEPCWYAVRQKGDWTGDRKQTTLWNIDKPFKSETGHSTQKPVECMARPILNHGKPGDSVYDPFLGSGTTMVAAHQAGRVCFGMEIDPHYCDVIVARMRALWPTLEVKRNGKTLT